MSVSPDSARTDSISTDSISTDSISTDLIGTDSTGTKLSAHDSNGTAVADSERGRVATSSRVRDARPQLSVAIIALGAISLVSDIVGIAQWPQTPMVWITIVTGVVALLLGLPALWIWHARQPRTLRTDTLFVLSVIVSLLGASFVSGGVVALGHGPLGAIAIGSAGAQQSGGNGSVHRPATVTLNPDHEIDLDSTDPGWGVVSDDISTNVPTEPDLQETLIGVTAINGAQLALSSDISYQGCRGATGYGDELAYDNAGINLGYSVIMCSDVCGYGEGAPGL